MSEEYYRVESDVDGSRGRKLFTGDDTVYSSMPVFAQFDAGSIVKFVRQDGQAFPTTEVLARAETARARVWGVLDSLSLVKA